MTLHLVKKNQENRCEELDVEGHTMKRFHRFLTLKKKHTKGKH